MGQKKRANLPFKREAAKESSSLMRKLKHSKHWPVESFSRCRTVAVTVAIVVVWTPPQSLSLLAASLRITTFTGDSQFVIMHRLKNYWKMRLCNKKSYQVTFKNNKSKLL